MSTFNESDHPRGGAGKFTAETKAGAGITLGASDDETIRHVRFEAMRAGERLAGEQVIALHEAGEDPSVALMMAERDFFCQIGDDIVSPAMDDLEEMATEIHTCNSVRISGFRRECRVRQPVVRVPSEGPLR